MSRDRIDALEKRKALQKQIDIEVVMGTENGRRFVWRLLEYTGIYHDISGDTNDMAKQLGNRQSGLYLLGIISDICEDEVFTMMKEAKNDTLTERIEHEHEDERRDREDGNGTDYFGNGNSGSGLGIFI